MKINEFVKKIRTGQLSGEEIGRGMHKSFKNACELIEDAEMLLPKSPGRAISLAVLALEETAKTILLTNAAAKAAVSPILWKDVEKELKLRSHAHKQAVFSAYGKALLDRLASENEDVFTDSSLPGGIGPLLDFMKQLGFYVDVANGQFISPAEFGSQNVKWAEWLINIVKKRLSRFEKLHGTEDGSINVARQAGAFTTLLSEASDEQQLKQKIKEFIEKYTQKT